MEKPSFRLRPVGAKLFRGTNTWNIILEPLFQKSVSQNSVLERCFLYFSDTKCKAYYLGIEHNIQIKEK